MQPGASLRACVGFGRFVFAFWMKSYAADTLQGLMLVGKGQFLTLQIVLLPEKAIDIDA